MSAERDSTPKTADPSTFPITLGGQFKKNLGIFLVGALILLTQQSLMAGRDILLGKGTDALRAGDSDGARYAVYMLAVIVVAGVLRWLSRVTIFNAGRNVEYELRAVLLQRLHNLGPSFFRKNSTGDIMSRATNDLTQVRLLLGFGVLNVLQSAFSFTSALYVMLRQSMRLTLAALVMVPILIGARRMWGGLFQRNKENQEAIGQMSDRVLASLAGVRVVRSFALEESELAAFDKVNENYVEKSLALARLRGSMAPVMGFVTAAGSLAVFWYGATLVLQNQITIGAFVSFWFALVRLSWPMIAAGFVWAILQRGRAGYVRLKEIFDAVPEVVSGPLPQPEKVAGGLSVRHLTFSYGTRKVLDDVSFEVPAGSSLAIVGRTGSGKTTIATLLARLYPTPHGTVFLDGQDICELPIETVRESVGYAQQDAFLFSTTVTRNIGYALDDADAAESMEPIQAAAREAQILPEILSLPDGFDTVVGERGVQLSGGQRQRTALSRGLLREPPILVLDDPLSAVDAKTEAAILAAIERQAAHRTVILITHRVAAARRCDSIVVLDAGHIIEAGTHDELVKNGKVYTAFAEEQQIEDEMAELAAREDAVVSSRTVEAIA